jgi:PAS domain S-box-containing protein
MAYNQANIYAQELRQEIAERRRTQAELELRITQLSLINGIGREIAAELNLNNVLIKTARLVQQTFDYHHVALYLIDNNQLNLKAVAGALERHLPANHTLPLPTGIAGWVATHGKKIVANNVNSEPKYTPLFPEHTVIQSELCLPITVAGQVAGILDIQSQYLDIFTDNHIIAMETLSDQLAIAVANARLHESIHRELTERKQAEKALQHAHNELEQRVEERTAALRKSEERYRDLFDNANDLIQSVDTKGHLTYVNRSWLQTMGYTANEVSNLQFENILLPDQIPHWRNILKFLRGGTPNISERLVLLTKNGQELVVEANLTPYFEHNQFIGCRGILRDITQREEVEKALATRLHYEHALSSCSQILLANIDVEEALKETLYELLIATGTSRVYIFENFEDDQLGLAMRQTHEVCALGIESHIDNPGLRKIPYTQGFDRWRNTLLNGEAITGRVESFPRQEQYFFEIRPALSTLLLAVWVEGEWYGFIGFDDISQPRVWNDEDIQLLQTAAGMLGVFIERKLAEKNMRESEEKYRTLIEQSSDAIYLLYAGKFEVINRKFEQLFGVTQIDANAPDFIFTNIVAPKSRNVIKELAQAGINKEQASPLYEFTALDKDNNEIEVELTVSYPKYRNGLATQGIIRDITERKRAEEEKRKAYQQVQQYANELAEKIKAEQRLVAELKQTQAQLIQQERLAALGQMAATVAHELRNPLMSIRLGVEYMLNDVGESDPRRRGASLMQANMDRIDRIVEDILFIARAPEPKLTLESLQQVIENEMAGWELALTENNITCITKLEPDLPPILLDCDQMGRALSNLIGNSVDAIGINGKLNVTLSGSNDSQVITLTDNGPGIPDNLLDKIFEPFFTTKSRGTGLGLSIVKQIIEYHHGHLEVWSQVGVGTKFTIMLSQGEPYE